MLGWFFKWRDSVDFGLRTRHVHDGHEINLYPFTKRGVEWLEQNLDDFKGARWSQQDRCFELSDDQLRELHAIVGRIEEAGLKVRFYGRLRHGSQGAHVVGIDGERRPVILSLERRGRSACELEQ